MAIIGFIGLGNMGAPMAANLVKAGETVAGFDVVAAACRATADAGGRMAASAVEAVGEADVVITMLPGGEQALAVWKEVLPAAKTDALFIDCSTIDVASARGLPSLDAPVSGGVGGARAATLTFMVGGALEAFARGKPVLERMGKRIVHCGPAGNGQAA